MVVMIHPQFIARGQDGCWSGAHDAEVELKSLSLRVPGPSGRQGGRDRELLQASRAGAWGIMRYMGLVEIAAILLFVALVVFAVWWLISSLRR